MEDATPKSQSAKSAHVIDLRQSGGAATRPATRSSKPAPKPAAAPRPKLRLKPPTLKKPAPVAAPVPEELPELPAAEPQPAPQDAPVVAKPISASYLDAPPQRRFWSAFWRFLLLLVIFGVVLTGGLYIYLKYYT